MEWWRSGGRLMEGVGGLEVKKWWRLWSHPACNTFLLSSSAHSVSSLHPFFLSFPPSLLPPQPRRDAFWHRHWLPAPPAICTHTCAHTNTHTPTLDFISTSIHFIVRASFLPNATLKTWEEPAKKPPPLKMFRVKDKVQRWKVENQFHACNTWIYRLVCIVTFQKKYKRAQHCDNFKALFWEIDGEQVFSLFPYT